jgi:heat shock protein HslJ
VWTYVRTGVDAIAFSRFAGTMMACADGMESESAFLKAMSRAKAWNVLESIVELYDEAGTLVARFEAQKAAAAK